MNNKYLYYGMILGTKKGTLTAWGECYKHMVACNEVDIKNKAGEVIRTKYPLEKFLKLVQYRGRRDGGAAEAGKKNETTKGGSYVA